jgi:hypothetical protein
MSDGRDINIMLDLETFSTRSDAAIASIGACAFYRDETYNWVLSKHDFEVTVKPESAQMHGHVDAGTMAWWTQQSEEARKIFSRDEPKVELHDALVRFSDWVKTFNSENKNRILVWGNGSDFDNVILTNAFLKTGIRRPWYYQNSRCFRTLKHMINEVIVGDMYTRYEFEGQTIKHNALHDAILQAKIAIDIMTAMKI